MKSIGSKLWAAMMVLVAIVLILLWLFQIVFLEKYYANLKVDSVKDECIDIISLYNNDNKSEFEKEIEIYAVNNNISLEIIDKEGDLLYTVGNTNNNGENYIIKNGEKQRVIEKAFSGEEVTNSFYNARFKTEIIMLGLPIISENTISAVMIVGIPIIQIEETVGILKTQLIIITCILLFSASIISYIITKMFIKPILEIKKISVQMANGEFSGRITNISKDEIGELAQSINYMGQELFKLEQLRKDLIANVSHELRTPLSLIKGYAEMIKDITGDNKIKREMQLDIIIEESDRLSYIVNDILNLSQMQSGNMEIKLDVFELSEVINIVADRFAILSEKTNITINIEGSVNCRVKGNKQKIEQVLYNLISNAFNHTDINGKIKIMITEDISKVKIQIIDDGSGIPEDDINHIWDRYYSGGNKYKENTSSGLGLAIVKNILESHDVKYGVESKLGVGTKFWFELYKNKV